MNSNQSKITIIVAVYNGAKTLQRCLDSVVEQIYSNWELIVIDGASKDETINIIKANHEHISYWESEVDRGIYHAFNKGVLKATGDWIIFLGCDDYFWKSDILTKASKELALLDSETKIAYGKVALISANNKVLSIKSKPWSECCRAYRHYNGGEIDHQGVFQHRSLFEEHGLFDESFRICGDYEILLRDLKSNDPYFLNGLIISARQIGGTSLQQSNGLTIIQECQRARQKNSLAKVEFLPQLMYLYLIEIVRKFLLNMLGEKKLNILTDLYRKITFREAVWTK
jgi:glycosyltransferase involved in cell wall biosynthesis